MNNNFYRKLFNVIAKAKLFAINIVLFSVRNPLSCLEFAEHWLIFFNRKLIQILIKTAFKKYHIFMVLKN